MFKNIYISQFFTGISFIVSFFLLFITTYFLSVEERGIFGLIYTLPSLLVTLTDFGIAPILIRYISKNEDSNKILASIFTLHIIRVFVITFLAFIIIFIFNDYLFKIPSIYLYLGLPVAFSLSANSYLSPYFFGSNKIIKYYLFLLFPNFVVLIFCAFLLLLDQYDLLNIIILSASVYFIHSIYLTYHFWNDVGIKKIKIYKNIYNLLTESKFLYFSNILNYGFVYVFPIFLNYSFGLVTLSYVLFCIAIADKLLLVGDSVGNEIIRRINVETDKLNFHKKQKYFSKVVLYITPVLILSGIFIFLFTKFVLLEYWFQKYSPVLEFLYLVIYSFIFQGFIRVYQQFYNGLGDTKFTFSIIAVGFLFKILCLFFVKESIINLYFCFIITDVLLLLYIISQTHLKTK